MRAGPTEGREREGMWADAGRDRDHAGLPGDVDCRSLGFLPACRAQAQALLLIIRLLDALFLVSAARPTHSAHGAVEGLKMRCGFVAAPRTVVASLQPREQSGGGLENALWLRCSPASRF